MSKKVLVIDNTMSPMPGSQFLTEEGYSVDTMHSPDAGLRQLDAQAYDVIILQESPEAESWQLCERIRHLSDTPLIVVSTNASADTCVKTIDAGADYFMRKTFGPLEFLARIQSLLQRTPIKQAAPAGNQPLLLIRA